MFEKKGTILLVDDEVSDREYMCRILQDHGYTVLEAASYCDAVTTYQQHHDAIEMLLTVLSLPENNGYELAKTLLEVNPDLKVLFVSGFAGAEVCKYYGMPETDVHLLRKPFQAADLLQRMSYMLATATPLPGLDIA